MEYSLAWISNPDVESCQIATETIKIEKNDQGLTQISAVSVTERQNHWSTPNIKYVLSTRLVNLNLALVASSLPSTPRKRRKESPRTRLSLTSGAPFHSTPIFSRSQNTNSDWAIVSFSYKSHHLILDYHQPIAVLCHCNCRLFLNCGSTECGNWVGVWASQRQACLVIMEKQKLQNKKLWFKFNK